MKYFIEICLLLILFKPSLTEDLFAKDEIKNPKETLPIPKSNFGGLPSFDNDQKKYIEEYSVRNKKVVESPYYYERDEPFNEERFLGEFKAFDCSEGYDEDTGDEIFNDECLKNLENSKFGPLSDLDMNHDGLYDNINENIYKPLGFQKEKKENIVDTLLDLLETDPEKTKIAEMDFPSQYGTFEQIILNKFNDIESGTDNMEENQKKISNLIKDTLISFHLYWNTLRSKGQIDKLKVDTKACVKQILQRYGKTETKLNKTTFVLAENVKKAYKTFIEAHQSVVLFKERSFKLISKSIIDRYSNFCRYLNSNLPGDIYYIKTLATLIDLIKTYYIVYKISNKQLIVNRVSNDMFEKIKKVFFSFPKGKDPVAYKNIKNFTVIFLLKIKHINYIIFKINSIGKMSVIQHLSFMDKKSLTVKIFHELYDNLMLIPLLCIDSKSFKSCSTSKVIKYEIYVFNKYGLKRSIGGFGLVHYIRRALENLTEDVNPEIWTNYILFKTFFYQRLFQVSQNMKRKFFINGCPSIKRLENMLSNVLSADRDDKINEKNTNFGLYVQMEIDLYEKFLHLFSTFDKFCPLYNDYTNFGRIENKIYEFMDDFRIHYNSKVNDSFSNLLLNMKKMTALWRKKSNVKENNKKNIYAPFPILNKNLVKANKWYHIPIVLKDIDVNKVIDDQNQEFLNLKIHRNMIKEIEQNKYDLIKNNEKDKGEMKKFILKKKDGSAYDYKKKNTTEESSEEKESKDKIEQEEELNEKEEGDIRKDDPEVDEEINTAQNEDKDVPKDKPEVDEKSEPKKVSAQEDDIEDPNLNVKKDPEVEEEGGFVYKDKTEELEKDETEELEKDETEEPEKDKTEEFEKDKTEEPEKDERVKDETEETTSDLVKDETEEPTSDLVNKENEDVQENEISEVTKKEEPKSGESEITTKVISESHEEITEKTEEKITETKVKTDSIEEEEEGEEGEEEEEGEKEEEVEEGEKEEEVEEGEKEEEVEEGQEEEGEAVEGVNVQKVLDESLQTVHQTVVNNNQHEGDVGLGGGI